MTFSHFTRRLLITVFLFIGFVLIGIAGWSAPASKQACTPTRLRAEIAHLAKTTHGPVGVAALVVEGGPAVAWHGEQHFPMQSVYKLPIAMTVLSQVDRGTLALNQPVRIRPVDLVPPSRGSPIRDKYPHGTVMTVSALLDSMMSVSDGTASDVLLHLVGGPGRVMAYLHGLGASNIVVATPEKEMALNEQVQYWNWATPSAMAGLLRTLQSGRGLSPISRQRLLGLMIGSTTGPDRIRGRLPAGTIVAHKTGTSGMVENGRGCSAGDQRHGFNYIAQRPSSDSCHIRLGHMGK